MRPIEAAASFRQATNQESIVVPIYKQTAGEFAYPSFDDLRRFYTQDPDAYAAVNFIASRALSHGFHIQCNAEAPNYLRSEAEGFLEDWMKYVRWGDRRNERGFTPLARIMTRELAWGGTTMLEQLEPGKIEALAQVELTSLWRVQRDEFGNLRWIWQKLFINPKPLHPERYVIYTWNMVDRQAFGYGLLHPLAQWKQGVDGGNIPPDILSKWQITDDIRRRLHRYGSPRSIFGVKGMSTQEAKDLAEQVNQPLADDAYVTNGDVSVASDTPTGRPNFAAELDYFDTRIQAGLQTPLIKLLTSSGFTQASATVAAELGDLVVWDLQETFKLTTENEILQPVLAQNGFDATLLKPQFEYNIPDEPEEWTVADVLAAAKPDQTTGKAIITPVEARRILRKFARFDLDPDPEPQASPGNLTTPGTPQVQPAQVTSERQKR